MKHFALSGLFALLFLTSCAGNGNIEVIKAEYGAGDSWKDVTDIARSKIKEGKLEIAASNETLGDPAPGTVKQLRLKLSCNGRETNVSLLEDQSIQADPENFSELEKKYASKEVSGDAQLIQNAVSIAYNKKLSKIVLEKRTYYLDCPSDSKWHLVFKKINNFTIDGNGSTFVFKTRDKRGICFDSCSNTALINVITTRETPPFSQGDIVAVSENMDYIDIEIHEGYPDDADSQQFFYKTPVLTVYDEKTRKLKKNVPDLYLTGIEKLKDGVFRFKIRNKVTPEMNLKVGNFAVWRSTIPGELCGHEIDIRNSGGMLFKNLTMTNARGLAIAELGGEGANRYENWIITYAKAPKGASIPPLLAGSADGLNSAKMRKGPILENCVIEGIHDDGVNIHGTYAMLVESKGKSIVVDYREGLVDFARKGDKIHIFSEKYTLAAEAVVESIDSMKNYQEPKIDKMPNSRTFPDRSRASYIRINLDREINLPSGLLIANPSITGEGFILRNVVTRDHRAHGFFIRAGNGLIENCTLENIHMGGIVAAPEFTSWNESTYCENLIIRNNTLRRVGIATQPWNCGITVAAWEGFFVPLPGGHRNITVEGNRMEDNDGPNMIISSTEKIVIRNNTFIRPMKGNSFLQTKFKINYDALIWGTETSNLSLSGNIVSDPGPYMKKLTDFTDSVTGSGLNDGIKIK